MRGFPFFDTEKRAFGFRSLFRVLDKGAVERFQIERTQYNEELALSQLARLVFVLEVLVLDPGIPILDLIFSRFNSWRRNNNAI
jgi:hypothetical protein